MNDFSCSGLNRLQIQIESLSYQTKPNIINSTSLNYNSTDTAIITGPIGSGKTSLLYCLSAIIPNIESFRHVKFNGNLDYSKNSETYFINRENYRWFFDKISVLFQYPDNNFIAERVFDEFKLLRLIGYDSKLVEFNRLIFQLKIRELGTSLVSTLSEGQKQMVSLACMFLRNPSFVYLDEPLTMLDKVNRFLFLDWLIQFKKYCNESGLIIASHKPMLYSDLSPKFFVFKSENKSFEYYNTIASEFDTHDLDCESDICITSAYYTTLKSSVSSPLIEVEGTVIWYNKNAPISGLSNLNFTLSEYQNHIITGLNGSGKSTLAKTLCGLHKKFKGRIRICGKELKEINPVKAGFIKMVVQIPSQQLIFKTVKDDICYSIKNLDKSHINGKLSQIEPFLKAFDISLEEDPHRLSFGQQKVVCLLGHLEFPKILIIDEPGISMDHNQQKTVTDIIKLYQDNGVTTILISHEPEVFHSVVETEFRLEK